MVASKFFEKFEYKGTEGFMGDFRNENRQIATTLIGGDRVVISAETPGREWEVVLLDCRVVFLINGTHKLIRRSLPRMFLEYQLFRLWEVLQGKLQEGVRASHAFTGEYALK